ncbi:sigma-70 family RNA polymerase sigma factor [Georgenia sp. M64]|uniref:RNA polymerase sigma factor n=1 Tax=Georgenia sp. M64 TaxID=3120520 RepID=UPI0030E188A4
MSPFEQVVTEHGPTVLRVCRALVGPVDADDAWSETFLAAMRAYPALDDGANVEAWLVTIARHKAIDLLRSRARRAVPVAELPERVVPPATHGHEAVDLWRALGELTERQREAVAYHHLAGLPYDQVAALVGGTAPAARRAAADGIRNLRERLGASS